MDIEELVKEVVCDTAEQFLSEMSPLTGRLWTDFRELGSRNHEWVFRGVADASFPLRPSAFRENAFAPFIRGQVRRVVTDPVEQRRLEDSLLVRFCTEADQRQIHIPSDRPELRDVRRAMTHYAPHEFPPVDRLHMYALAQHYGIPTRLLDWTRRPLIAAYFAVRDVAQAHAKRPGTWASDGSKPCAVWALDLAFLHTLEFAAREDPSIDPVVHIVTAPYATNPNLAAQGGLFTLVQPRSGDPHPIPDVDAVVVAMADKILASRMQKSPVMVKFVLPPSEARVALRFLYAEGVTAAAVRPGLQGVVEAMRESWACQSAPRGRRA